MLGHRAAHRAYPRGRFSAIKWVIIIALWYKDHWERIGYTHDKHTDRVAQWPLKYLMTASDGGAVVGIEIQYTHLEACEASAPLSAVSELPEGAVGIVHPILMIDGHVHLSSLPVLNDGGVVSPL